MAEECFWQNGILRGWEVAAAESARGEAPSQRWRRRRLARRTHLGPALDHPLVIHRPQEDKVFLLVVLVDRVQHPVLADILLRPGARNALHRRALAVLTVSEEGVEDEVVTLGRLEIVLQLA